MPPAYDDDWLEWNLGRERAGSALDGVALGSYAECRARP
jgi:hypothetical protein